MAGGAAMRERAATQTFLSGPELYLRAVEPADADSAPIWNSSPIPRPPEVEKERIEEQLGGDVGADMEHQRLLICRRSDDRPLGSVVFTTIRTRVCHLGFTYDPNASRDEWARICGETLRLAVPWLLHERSRMAVFFSFPGEHPLVEATAAELGMRRCFRMRERLPMAGERIDTIGYEALHPEWVGKLGLPRGMEEGSVVREVAKPAPRTWVPTFAAPESSIRESPIPDSAIVVGERLYLRAFTPEDAERASHLLMEETEISFPEGRDVVNPYVHARNIRETARAELPRWLHLAIVLGETGEMIGANGLINPDLVAGVAETETEIWSAEHRNKGYGTEAKHLLLEYAFERLHLHMVYSWVSEFNVRSAAALRKQGYRDAGSIAWSAYHGTELYGALLFDLLASEWRAARR